MSGEALGVGSTARLVTALVEAGASAQLVARAQADEFHDYKSPHAMPQHQLLAAARREGLDGIARRVIAGEFDGTDQESREWAASPEGQATFTELLKGVQRL